VALVKDIKEANLNVGGGRGGINRVQRCNETTVMVRRYRNMVLDGKVRAAVQMVTSAAYKCTVQLYFWHARQRSDARHVSRPDY
jgi:hypothetical protein